MYYTYMVGNIQNKKEVRMRLGKKTVGESMRNTIWIFVKKVLKK